MSLQIVAVKRRHWLQQGSITKGIPQSFYQAAHLPDRMRREAYKYVLYPGKIGSTIYSPDSAKSSRPVSESPDKFSPLTQNRISTVLTFIAYIEDCKPDSACERYRYCVIPTRCTAIHISRLKMSMRRCLRHSSRLS
jgi:hypothetical protein